MIKLLLSLSFVLMASAASAEPFSKQIQLNAGVVYFLAEVSNGQDQFGNSVVVFSNPTVNGVTISIQSKDSEAVNLKTQLCEKLGYAFANGLGIAERETSYLGFFLDDEKQLTVKLFETQSRITYFNCLGSI